MSSTIQHHSEYSILILKCSRPLYSLGDRFSNVRGCFCVLMCMYTEMFVSPEKNSAQCKDVQSTTQNCTALLLAPCLLSFVEVL